MGAWNEGVEFGIATVSVFILTFVIEYIRHLRSKSDVDQKPRDMREQCANTASCFIFLLLTAAAYIRRPDDQKNDPSILISTGAGLQLYAFCLLYLFPRAMESSTRRAPAEFGLLFVYALVARTWCTMMYNGYLPADETGDGCIQMIEAVSGIIGVAGLVREGVSGKAVANTAGLLVVAWACSMVCYGALDHRPWVDRYYASSLYAELLAWVVMFHAAYTISKSEQVDGIYLLPSFVQAVCRSYAWYAAYVVMELIPQRNPQPLIRLMEWFPLVIVILHFSMSMMIAGIGALCIKDPPHVGKDAAEALFTFV